jgi:hypothetical protein
MFMWGTEGEMRKERSRKRIRREEAKPKEKREERR